MSVKTEQLEYGLDYFFVKRVVALFSFSFNEHEPAFHKRLQVVRDHTLLLVQMF